MAGDCALSVGTKISEYLVEPLLIRPLRPIFCFKSFVDEFQTETRNLVGKKERVENSVKQARDKVEEMDQHVHKWLEDAIQVTVAGQMLQSKLEEKKSSCFSGAAAVGSNRSHCFSLGWTCRYRLSRQVREHTDTIKKHYGTLDESRDLVSRPMNLIQHIELPEDFVFSESASSALLAVTEALMDAGVNKIGLYSAGGAGKTTLARLVYKEAKKFSIFSPIMVTVPQNLEITVIVRMIQGTIGDFLNLTLNQEGEEGRAAKLRQRLGNGEKILIILDDVLEELDLARVGIPSSGHCKVLLTTNDLCVCNLMKTERHVPLNTLSEEEAWGLFKRVADVDDRVRSDDVTSKAVSFCSGLPKALVTVGMALRGTEHFSWEDRLQHLKNDQVKEVVSLRNEAEKLSVRKESVQKEVVSAMNNAQVIDKEVETWLANVESVMEDSKKLFIDVEENNNYFGDWHKVISKKALELITIVKNLFEDGAFGQVAHFAPIHQYMGLSSSEEYAVSKSADSTFHKIMDALVKDDVNKIGLHGMGGIGKTTLAEHVRKEAERSGIFDCAVMVTVSQTPDVRKIQGVIADFLNMELRQESENGRLNKLNQRLKTGKILIILDDVWEKFDLANIGMSGDCKGCKVLFTTRRLHVCTSMGCQTNIELQLLSQDEAWDFFRKKADIPYDFNLNVVAKQIVRECKCLPIALTAVGLALRNKSGDNWIEALDKLKSSRLVDIPEVGDDDKNAYKCLRMSYDYLKHSRTTQAQFLLLLCSLFPEDYEIDTEDLATCAFGMGLFERVRSINDARRKVRVTVQLLKDSGLLLGTDKEECIKMHDVVRDVALWIGGTEPSENSTVAVRDGTDLGELIKSKRYQNCRAISFMHDSLSELSNFDRLECPKLETVLIFLDRGDIELPDTFFKHMKTVKVLDVRCPLKRLWGHFSLPQSLQYLTDLQTLNLSSMSCYNSHLLGELTNLKILSLHRSNIDCNLEAILMKMKKLRLLDFTRCRSEGYQICPNVIKDMTELEELYTLGASLFDDDDEDGERGKGLWLSKVNSLQSLVRFLAYIDGETRLPMDFCFPDMEMYYIVVGGNEHFRRKGYGKGLVLIDVEERSQLNAFRKLFTTVEFLDLSNLNLGEDFKNIIPCWVDAYGCAEPKTFLQNLKELSVEESVELETLFDFEKQHSNQESQEQSLQILTLNELPELKHIWKGCGGFVSLCNLTHMYISKCRKLKTIFSSAVCVAPSLQQLEVFSIMDCDNLEEVVSASADLDDHDFSCCFQNLRILTVNRCRNLKVIFSSIHVTMLHLPKLQHVSLSHNKELEHVFGQCQSAAEAEQWPSLQELKVGGCPKLSSNFVANILAQLQAPSTVRQLRSIDLGEMQGVEEIIQLQTTTVN